MRYPIHVGLFIHQLDYVKRVTATVVLVLLLVGVVNKTGSNSVRTVACWHNLVGTSVSVVAVGYENSEGRS
jgi:hypothetical protein